MKRCALIAVLVLAGCKGNTPTVVDAGPPKPKVFTQKFEPLEREPVDGGDDDPMYRVAPFTPVGPAVPEGAVQVQVVGEHATVAGASFDVKATSPEAPVVLVPDAETYLAQVAPLLAALDDAGRTVWLQHPDGAFAYPLVLRDEPGFQAWLEDPTPGKVRVIHRADGFELMTNMGKLPGPDLNGPTVPVRGGKMDLATLQKGLGRLQKRFKDAPDFCLLPSFGTSMADVARAISANYAKADSTFFGATCLIYPRPRAKDAGP